MLILLAMGATAPPIKIKCGHINTIKYYKFNIDPSLCPNINVLRGDSVRDKHVNVDRR